ncbi:hypothetical protein HM1_1021 [Heliomicrobium modesticaldum Ice1]|uniref:Uncharacterized protein n=1 Tax=Heliobacterium modesticaldum (strain ATCC 51547 / Ice1) TaxID=498761 RepID=B0TID3_HELMI|nr:hypothetical protein HM1_1021 [Heliomicrobium modesticaldum Ice1]
MGKGGPYCDGQTVFLNYNNPSNNDNGSNKRNPFAKALWRRTETFA